MSDAGTRCRCTNPVRVVDGRLINAGHVMGCPALSWDYAVNGPAKAALHQPPPDHSPAYDGRQQPGRWCCSFHMNDVEGITEPCAVPGCGEKAGHHLHRPASGCLGCQSPRDHHAYVTPVLGVTPIPEGSSIGTIFRRGPDYSSIGTIFRRGLDYEEAGVAALWGQQARKWRTIRAITIAGRVKPAIRLCRRRLAPDAAHRTCGHTRPEHWAVGTKHGTSCIVRGCGCLRWKP